MAMSGGKDDGSPMMDMNTTPLIDVMLVLLIMFIITIPPITHAVKIDLPVASPPQDGPVIDPVINKLNVMDTGEIYWNGEPYSLQQVASAMQAMASMADEPELQFQPTGNAPYLVVDEVLAEVKKAKITKFGFVGNESYPGFAKAKADFK